MDMINDPTVLIQYGRSSTAEAVGVMYGVIGLIFIVLIIVGIIQHHSQRKVLFVHPRTREGKYVRVGFNWVFFFLSGFFGVPLFVARLYGWGVFFLGFWLARFGIDFQVRSVEGAMVFGILFLLVGIILHIYMGAEGNKLKAKKLVEDGFVPQLEGNDRSYILGRWGIAEGSIPQDGGTWQGAHGSTPPSPPQGGARSSDTSPPPPPPLQRKTPSTEKVGSEKKEGERQYGSKSSGSNMEGLEKDLAKLKDMYDQGLLEEEEYREMRQKKIEEYK